MIKIKNIIVTIIYLSLPVSLITANATYLINSNWLYSYNWNRNNIPVSTNLSIDDLNFISNKIKTYFSDDNERLNIKIKVNGYENSIYNEKEITHMIDVKNLIKFVYMTSIVSTVILILSIISLIYFSKENSYNLLSSTIKNSFLIFGSIVSIFILASITNFTWVFTKFHMLSFSNDLWILDPKKDMLIMMFPERFFLETTLLIGLFTICEYIAIWFGFHINSIYKKLD